MSVENILFIMDILPLNISLNTMAYAESDTAIGERNMNSATGDIFLFRLVSAAAAVVRTVLSGTKRSVKIIVWPMLLMNASSLNSLI